MVGYRRQKYLLFIGLTIVVLVVLFYYHFGSDGKPLNGFTVVFGDSRVSGASQKLGSKDVLAGNSFLKPYDNFVQFDHVSTA